MTKPHFYKTVFPAFWYCTTKDENGYISGCGYTVEQAYADYLRMKTKILDVKSKKT